MFDNLEIVFYINFNKVKNNFHNKQHSMRMSHYIYDDISSAKRVRETIHNSYLDYFCRILTQ